MVAFKTSNNVDPWTMVVQRLIDLLWSFSLVKRPTVLNNAVLPMSRNVNMCTIPIPFLAFSITGKIKSLHLYSPAPLVGLISSLLSITGLNQSNSFHSACNFPHKRVYVIRFNWWPCYILIHIRAGNFMLVAKMLLKSRFSLPVSSICQYVGSSLPRTLMYCPE